MFPSSETKANMQRDYWYEQKEIVRSAISVWIKGLKGVSIEEFTIFLDMTVVEDNKNFDDTYIDVDDFLWLVMHQWAVLMETYLKTAQDRFNYLIRHDEQSQTSHA